MRGWRSLAQRQPCKEGWTDRHQLNCLSWTVTADCLVQLYLFPHQRFPQGVQKMKRTSLSDPVRCCTEQNITSWLFQTSKQTFAGPLLPKKKTLSRRGKASSLCCSHQPLQNKVQSERKHLTLVESTALGLENTHTKSCAHTRNSSWSSYYLTAKANPPSLPHATNPNKIHSDLCLFWQKPVTSKWIPALLVKLYLFL